MKIGHGQTCAYINLLRDKIGYDQDYIIIYQNQKNDLFFPKLHLGMLTIWFYFGVFIYATVMLLINKLLCDTANNNPWWVRIRPEDHGEI